MYSLLWLLTVHFWADFVCQTDRQATQKSRSYAALTSHVATYTGIVGVGGLCVLAINDAQATLSALSAFVLVTFVTHWITDAITSRVNAHFYRAGRRHAFFVGIGADQLVHAWTLGLTALWLLGGSAR